MIHMITYEVKEDAMADYLSSLDRRRILIILLVNLFFVITGYLTEIYRINIILFWCILLLTLIVSMVSWLDLRKDNDKLRQLAGSRYFIDDQTIKFLPMEMDPIEFQLKDVAVIHRKYSGTQVVAGVQELGMQLTGVSYFTRMKSRSFSLGDPGTIFIPRITSNYEDLISTLILKSGNAIKYY